MSEVIYGINPVLEALRSGEREFVKIQIAAGKSGKGILEIESLAKSKGIKVEITPNSKLPTQNFQGVVAIVSHKKEIELHELVEQLYRKDSKPVIVILDGIEDPGNLGAIIRSAEALGIGGVIIPKDRAAGVTPVVVKRSAGAIEHIPVVRVTNISNTIEELKEKGFWIVGVEAGAEKNCFSLSYNDPIAVVFGSESKGMRRLTKEKCDFIVSIPMKGKVSSLNVSAACSIIFYEILRQRLQ
ncbi:MAG: 23S rRNA (guanosine(2251)-2'-O)-methyltransferase RlmB [Nitrospinae bacterium RIFCSPLOWO2_12_39_16]|nr:MAG: 23S rRNA (guanosine(2251)-2'-O)-methyltransferase RlmB [Nitrospinae bacterium RIFCSPLOWO2_02_39_17]OGW09949.1 MAG: 23S rRNA (guanosine(2251)-2'-O)-methyltransferase RlmB [Nitrospinae bacterium RIFCSPLOWO2_12_39_16]HLA48065.1 23S rRNA (guanosine(2251)-2'-O)-methyltransferase RlmB [Nitrospinota bacterium]